MPDPDTAPPAADAPPPPDLSGRILGDFQVLRRLGAGGMGQVYLARQTSLKRDVALKFLRGELTTNPTALARFQAEAEAVARLNHANIVQVYAVGEADGLRYMALEYVEGRNLRDYLARKGPPDLPICLSLMRQVASALQRAHEQGIVHRDIKPENILITRRAEVKVTDFGLSRFFAGPTPALNLTQSGVTLGTPLYMAPEQVQGHPVDHRTDIYSFGVTCYHLLTGEPPYRGNTAFDVAMKHVQGQPKPIADTRPDLPADLCGMVHKMMAKDPADRYQSAREIVRDLAKVREGVNLGLTQAMTGGLPLAPPANGSGSPSGAVLSLSGVGSQPGVGSGFTPGLTPAGGVRPRPRWPLALAAGLCGLVAVAGGVGLYAAVNPADPGPPPFAGPGLPDVRTPDRLTTTRERELIDLLNRRETPPEKVIAHTIELGLLYVRERRLDDADARFSKLDAERFTGAIQKAHAQVVGALGRAVVLAHRDQAGKSNDGFEAAIKEAGKRPAAKGPSKPAVAERAAKQLLLNHPDLAQAVSEALNRNAANLGVPKLKAELEPFRTAKGVTGPG